MHKGAGNMDNKHLWIQFLTGSFILAFLAGCTPAAQETPTAEPNILFEVTLDGEECTFSGPTEVSTGKIDIAFDIKGDRNFGPWVDRFTDGKTFQDFLDIYLGPEEPHPEPVWVKHPPYFTEDHEVWTLTLNEPGQHAILVGSYTPWREYICGPFQVNEAAAD
jgi:hypothetical protein